MEMTMLQARKFLVALAAFGIAGLWSASASAGCKNIGGTYMCASWITGSEDLLATITGLGNIKDTCDPTTGSGCPRVGAGVFGTNGAIDITGNVVGQALQDQACDPFLNPDADPNQCAVTGVLYCVNPASKSTTAQGQPFSLSAALFNSGFVGSNDCSRNGKCTKTVKVGEVGSIFSYNPCINSNWQPKAFVANQFYGVSRLDYLDNKNVSQTLIVYDVCYVTSLPSTFKPGQSYTCAQIGSFPAE
jgi:hypothetical protein